MKRLKKRNWLRAKATLPWVTSPQLVGIHTFIRPGEIVDLYSNDDGATWFIPYGPILKPHEHHIKSVVREYADRPAWVRFIFG